jgi:Asp-tRNA(Asn)/Glu-tRNA(Gln) amidotransferase A subunit family amidase
MEISGLSLKELATAIQSGTLSKNEVYAHFLNRIQQYNSTLEAFNSINETPDFSHE